MYAGFPVAVVWGYATEPFGSPLAPFVSVCHVTPESDDFTTEYDATELCTASWYWPDCDMVTRWTRLNPAPAVDAVVDNEEAHAVNDPPLKLFVWLVDCPSEITVDATLSVENCTVPAFRVDALTVELLTSTLR